ncbi:MAG: O-antigen ligase family protein [Verrucomicrobiia bacterium]
MKRQIDNSEPAPASTINGRCGTVAALSTGLFLGVVLSKGGNPVIFSDKIEPPQNFFEIIFQPFPFYWLYLLLGTLFIINLFCHFKLTIFKKKWILFLPLPWFIWQLLAAFHTVDTRLTSQTLPHFFACIICFYIGVFNKEHFSKFSPSLLTGILLGFLWTIWNGFDQHFGGLEAIRQNFEKHIQQLPPNQRELIDTYEFRVKILSNRIFSTFIYPNAFAGGLLLLTPPLFCFVHSYFSKNAKPRPFAIIVSSSIIAVSLVCLYWTGSKSGLIIAAVTGSLIFLKSTLSKKIKLLSAILIVLFAGAFVVLKYADYFQRGAKSLGARFDYWNAAAKITIANPVFGTGPGTFSIPYRKIKPPEAEMARLAHNDYLEQASDSGIFGMLFYVGFVLGVVIYGYKTVGSNKSLFPYWLGFCAYSLHCLFEFHLYIPALAYPAFVFSGILLAARTDSG